MKAIAFAVFLLIRTIWDGGAYAPADHQQLYPPTPHVVITIEPSMDACRKAGRDWYAKAIQAGQTTTLPVNAATYDCVLEAVGGDDA